MSTGLQALSSQQKLVEWSERVSACRSSGKTVPVWCRENGVNIGSYYRWQRKLFEMATAEQPQFAEVSVRGPASPAIILHIGGTEVEVFSGIDEETLRTVCRVLRYAE